MKTKDFAIFLSAVADLLDAAESSRNASAWRDLLPMFEVKPTASVSELCKVIGVLQIDSSNSTSSLHAVTESSDILHKVLASAGIKIGQKKPTSRDDLDQFIAVLMPVRSISPSALVDAVREKFEISTKAKRKRTNEPKPDILDTYLPRLEQALGNESQFTQVFNALKTDKRVGAPDAKKLSKAFAKETARTKVQALDLIWAHHSSLMDSRAKAAATAGRTAG